MEQRNYWVVILEGNTAKDQLHFLEEHLRVDCESSEVYVFKDVRTAFSKMEEMDCSPDTLTIFGYHDLARNLIEIFNDRHSGSAKPKHKNWVRPYLQVQLFNQIKEDGELMYELAVLQTNLDAELKG